MKRIVLLTACLGAAVGAAYITRPAEFVKYRGEAETASQRVWDNVQANPAPVLLAAVTFLVTVVYHKAKGKSLRESVEAAATRVTVVRAEEPENLVVRRAKARATRTQLLADQVGLQLRQRKLPEAVVAAEKDVCYAEQGVADAERKLADRKTAHDQAVAKLDALRKEKAAVDADLAEIEVELKKMAHLV
jgi:hypothetical protein